jgi:hypothetical protein
MVSKKLAPPTGDLVTDGNTFLKMHSCAARGTRA